MIKKVKLLIIIFLLYNQLYSQDKVGMELKSSMIWDAAATIPDTVPARQSFPVSAVFLKQFILSDVPAKAVMQIFADARYMLWINGEYVSRGPNRFDPKRAEYDTYTITRWLTKGKNTIAIMVQSGLSNYKFIYHNPGLGVLLEATDKKGKIISKLATDTTWRSSSSTRFGPPGILLGGVTDNIDENLENTDWFASGFDESSWKKAIKTDGRHWGGLYERMIPLLRESVIEGKQIINIKHDTTTLEINLPADSVLPVGLEAPATLLIDIGRMTRAWFELDFESEGASSFELIPRQSYSDRTAEFLGSCSYKTTTRPGRRSYITTDDYTCRLVYLKLNTGKIKIHGLKVVERRYPFDRTGSFHCNDDFLNQLWEMSMRTSEVDATDGYIDGSEGGEWVTGAIDYPVTEVAFSSPDKNGKPIYSDMRLLGNQISRMALSQEGDELIKGWHPSDWHKGPRDQGRRIHNYIEDSSLSWINLLRIYFDGTGDRDLVEREWPVLEKIVKWFLERRTGRGLVNAREFYLHFDNPLAFQVCEGATLNAFVYGALVDAAFLADKTGKKEEALQYSVAAAELKKAYNTYLWDRSSGTYYAGLKKEEKKLLSPWPHEPWKAYYASIDQESETFPPTVQSAVMALSRGLVPAGRLALVQKYLISNHYDFVSPLSYLFAFEAFYRMNTDSADQEVLNTMRNRWSVMVARKMPGTLGEQFDDKSYYCHDFGPIPSSFIGSYIMGVRRDGPIGNRRIIIEPRLGDLTEVQGVVVTRHGPVPVYWKRTDTRGLDFRIKIPEGITASVSIPKPSEKPVLTIDGRAENRARQTDRFLIVDLGQGDHFGNILP